jgi:hypothetical protein
VSPTMTLAKMESRVERARRGLATMEGLIAGIDRDYPSLADAPSDVKADRAAFLAGRDYWEAALRGPVRPREARAGEESTNGDEDWDAADYG